MSASGFGGYDTITLGNGAGDTVSAGNSAYDTITLGNGTGDTVNVTRQRRRHNHPRQRRR